MSLSSTGLSHLSLQSKTICSISTSAERGVKLVVAQGSLLCPLLFILFINHIFKLDLTGFITAYADDVTLVVASRNLNELEMATDLCKLSQCFTRKQLNVNHSKT